MKTFLKITILALFVGFQAAQALHTHKAVSLDNCQTCQAVHQAPATGPEASPQFLTRLVFERLQASQGETFAAADVASFASIRAPPAA